MEQGKRKNPEQKSEQKPEGKFFLRIRWKYTHAMGGRYVVQDTCRVQIDGVWHDGVIYLGIEGKEYGPYVRTQQDFSNSFTPDPMTDDFDKTKVIDVLPAKLTSANILEVIDKLPHSKGRVPYTYHHDYLRMRSKLHSEMSRSQVASSHKEDDTELYAVALTQLLDELGSQAIYHLSAGDVIICKKAKEITDAVISRYNNSYKTDGPVRLGEDCLNYQTENCLGVCEECKIQKDGQEKTK